MLNFKSILSCSHPMSFLEGTIHLTTEGVMSLRNEGSPVPILFGMDIAVSYSVMKPLRRIDAL
jgi:hypothetical protein